MPTRIYPIDWREQLARLGPFLRGTGGVARVRYSGERCAPSTFLDMLKSEYEFKDDNQSWQSICIDYEVYSVRYLSGIRDELVRKIGLNLCRACRVGETAASIAALKDVEASGDIDAYVEVTQHHYSSG